MAEYMRSKVGEILLEAGLITPEQLDSVLVEQKTIKKRIGRLLIDKGWLAEDQLLSTLGEQLNLPLVNLYNCKIDAEVANCISVEMARRHMIIPVESIDKQIVLAMADPLDLSALDDVAMVTGLDVAPVIAGESAIAHAINQFYGMRESPEYRNDGQGSVVREGENPRWPAVEVAEAPVVKIVNSLIHRAIDEGASDIHLEPTGEGLRIRMRLDGILHDLTSPPQYAQAHIIARVKIMADLDVAEKRLPQDGNIQVQHSRDGINLRVSTMPTIHGEKVVIRLLEKQKIILPLEGLGFSEKSYRTLSRLLLNRAGMILVAGPTGCGKTTTLYSALNFINHPEDNIITVEDPVEYHLEGINQIQVNYRINRTFANVLRSILRQDPDVIMVGEIRDLETAKIATQAALTGHLVLSTLHTNNASGAVSRLIDMGMESYLVTASLVGVVAQRLVRKNCLQCSAAYRLAEEERLFFQQFFHKVPPEKLSKGSGCKYCNQTGYRGRISIQELLVLNQELKGLILNGATAEMLQVKAVEQGMVPLISDGLRCLEAGITTVDEVVRTVFSSVFDAEASGYAESTAFTAQLQKRGKRDFAIDFPEKN